MAIEKSDIEAKLGTVIDPNMETDLVSSKSVKSIEADGDAAVGRGAVGQGVEQEAELLAGFRLVEADGRDLDRSRARHRARGLLAPGRPREATARR